MSRIFKIGIIGAGYVGLITGACLASKGHKVVCWDKDKNKISLIFQGKTPFFEKGLSNLLLDSLNKTFFIKHISTFSRTAKDCDIIFICVGTPSKKDGSIDLTQVLSVAKLIAKEIMLTKKRILIVMKSTVIPGTTLEIKKLIEKESGKKAGVDFGISMNPEFLREGSSVQDFFYPDRLVFGVESDSDYKTLCEVFYFVKAPILRTDLKTAEMIKYASNAFLATKVSFINEIGILNKRLGIDTHEVAYGMGLDSRIGPKFLEAGIGFGGSCFPKDLRALVSKFDKEKIPALVLKSVLEVNEKQPLFLVKLIKKNEGILRGKKIGVLGLAFKEDTDDMRESRAIPIIRELLKEGAQLLVFDHIAMQNAEKIFGNSITYAKSANEVVQKTDFVLILSNATEFRKRSLYGNKRIYAGRKIFPFKSGENYNGICW